MRGLYERALQKRREMQLLRIVREEDLLEGEDLGISPDERVEILGQIKTLTRRVGPGERARAPVVRIGRSGAAFPLLVNGLSLLVLAAAAAVMFVVFNRQRQTMVSEATRLLTAEARVVRAVQEEARARISQKDQEISDIEERLSQVSSEQERLRAEIDDRVRARELELETQLSDELEGLRRKLIEDGVAETEIRGQLDARSAAKQQEYDVSLAAFKETASQELAERERAGAALEAELNSSLVAARSDRAAVEAEYAGKTIELERARAGVEQQLQGIEAERRREQLVADQITASYESIRREALAGRYREAMSQLDSLQAYLGTEMVTALSSFERQRSVELFVVGALRELFSRHQDVASEEASVLVESARLLQAVEGLSQRAETLRASDDEAGAERVYREAIEQIPAVRQSFARLEEFRSLRDDALAERVSGIIDAAERARRSGSPDPALAAYREALAALGLGQDGLRLAEGIAAAGQERAARSLRNAQTQSAAPLLADAGGRLRAGDAEAALLSYLSILERFPDADSRGSAAQGARDALSAIGELRREELATERAAAAARVARAEQAAAAATTRADQAEQAAAAATTRADQAQRASAALQDRERSGAEARAREWDALAGVLQGLETRSAGAGTIAGTPMGYDELLSLLEVKLRVRQVLLSADVRAQYPELEGDFERYIETLGRTKLEEGRAAGRARLTQELAGALQALRDPETSAGAAPAGSTELPALPGELVRALREILARGYD